MVVSRTPLAKTCQDASALSAFPCPAAPTTTPSDSSWLSVVLAEPAVTHLRRQAPCHSLSGLLLISSVPSSPLPFQVVLLHDGKSSGAQFASLINSQLGGQFRVVCPDLPGHGASAPALFPATVYTVAGLAAVTVEVIDQLKIPNAVIIGSGIGAQIALAVASRLGPRTAGVVLCDLELSGSSGAPSAVDPKFPSGLMRPISGAEFKSIGSLISRLPGVTGVLGGSCPLELAKALPPASLWRSAVQVVPQAEGSIPFSQPEAFTSLCRAYIADLLAAPAPQDNVGSDFIGGATLMRSDWSKSQQALNPNFRGRAVPGSMPHPCARFEAPEVPTEHDLSDDHFNQSMQISTNPNNRGRIVAGTMPHPGSRYEATAGADEDHFVDGMGGVDPDAVNPNTRGRIEPGTMPHPAARFDYAPPEDRAISPTGMSSPEHAYLNNGNVSNQDHFGAGNTVNPNLRGRIVPGTMPHPASRFDYSETRDAVSPTGAIDHICRLQSTNTSPNARGRMIPGTMPHPNARYEPAPEPDSVGPNGRSSTRVAQAPGGNSTFVFG